MTLYVVEIPHQTPPSAWARETKQEVFDVVQQVALRHGEALLEEVTGQELLDLFGPELDDLRETDPALAALIEKHGTSATFYKRYDDDTYSVEPRGTALEAALDWNAHDLSRQLVFYSTVEARAAVENERLWANLHQGWAARDALEKAL